MKRFIKKIGKIIGPIGPGKQYAEAQANIKRLKPLIRTRKLQAGIIRIQKKYRKKKTWV